MHRLLQAVLTTGSDIMFNAVHKDLIIMTHAQKSCLAVACNIPAVLRHVWAGARQVHIGRVYVRMSGIRWSCRERRGGGRRGAGVTAIEWGAGKDHV